MLPGTVIGDRFEIERTAGSGGMGVVFRAQDRLDGAPVAIKLLRGEASIEIERFDREAAVLADLRHPGIVRYIAHGATPLGQRYLAMEWLEGEDLGQRFARRRLTQAHCLTLMRRITGSLAVAHARGVVHRDIKPSNIFLVSGDVERAKLLDFGVARLTGGTQRITQSGALVGTPGYMAPEQAQGLTSHDPRSDVFSLGCVLFECLSGRPAFEGAHAMALLAKVILQQVPALRKLRTDAPEPVERLVARMLAKEPEKRPRDAIELAAEIEELGAIWDEWTARTERITLAGTEPPSSVFPSLLRGALTLTEQRIVSVVLVGARGASEARSLAAPEIERCGGRLNVLANGSMLVTIWGSGSAVDRAERAARCALTMQAHFADAPVCVVTGRGIVSARVVEGEIIDRGVRVVRAMKPGVIHLDSVTAGMLGPRFLIAPDGSGSLLRGERLLRDTAALLLGKATPCVGRSRELSILDGVFSGCVEESLASAVLVIGPAGSGKSRLRREFIEKLRQRDEPIEILSGRADSIGESSPFGPIADAIRDAAGIREIEPIESRRQKLTQRLQRRFEGERLTHVTAFLGELTRAPFPDDDHKALRAARDNAQLMGDAMRAAWEDWLTAECEAQPVVLILEDLHWADAATVQMIDATLRNLRELPLMVLVLARPEVHTRFPGLWAERDIQTIKLSPLSRKASEQLVRGALGGDVGTAVVTRIVDRADGNPFYLEELVRAVAAGRDDAFPDSVLGTVEARLDAEGAEAKRILRAASVFGARFSRRGVAALLGGDGHLEEAGAWLEVLAAREIITLTGAPNVADDTGYAFRHALIREAAYATLTAADRSLGHRLAGAWLEQIGYPDAMTLAEHFRRGEEPTRAAHWYRRAAEEALEANDLSAVLDRVERGVACGASGEDLGVLRLVEAEAHLWRGELALAEQRGATSIGLLLPGTATWFRAISQVVIAAGKLGGFDRVEKWVEPAAASIPAGDAQNARIICLSWCATLLIFGGRSDAANTLIEALEPMTAHNAQAMALIHQTCSFRASAAGDPGSCLEGLEAALAAFEQAGDHRNACATHANLGFVRAELGDFEGAEGALRAALTTADRMGLHEITANALHNLGHVLAYRGQLEEARRLEEQAAEALQKQGNPRLLGLARTYLAKIHGLAGDVAAAEREARAAADALLTVPPLRAGALAVLARALLAAGRVEEALSAASEASALLASLGTIEEGEALVRLVYAEALDASGREPEFIEAITAARDHLLARSAKISDPTWRERFLDGVPDNALTVAMAARLGARTPRSEAGDLDRPTCRAAGGASGPGPFCQDAEIKKEM